jgi:hypothetical protein
MNFTSLPWRRRAACALIWCSLAFALRGFAAPQTLYSTQFEPAQGFSVNNALTGSGGWTSFGTGGNGIVTNFITGFGQSAYIGYLPAAANNGLYLLRPLNFTPTNRPSVQFSVDWVIFDSSTTNRDEFRWSVYNIAGQRLFSIILDNRDVGIYYQLDDGVFRETGWGFDNESAYTLRVNMNFASNLWSAVLGNIVLVTNARITTVNASRTLGDIDAVWLPGLANKAGDNFMVFDNYTVTADILPVPPAAPARLQLLGAVSGQQLIRVNGQTNASYALEGSTNLVQWTALKTNVATAGFFDHLDTGSTRLKQRFYRARWVP